MIYNAPIKDMLFLLTEWIGIDKLTSLPGYEEVDIDIIDSGDNQLDLSGDFTDASGLFSLEIIPDIPIGVDAKLEEDPHKTLREKLAKTTTETCWRCHKKMNPLGLPFESFDDFGRFREHSYYDQDGKLGGTFYERERAIQMGKRRGATPVEYPTQKPIDTSGELTGTADPKLDGEVKDAFELVDRLVVQAEGTGRRRLGDLAPGHVEPGPEVGIVGQGRADPLVGQSHDEGQGPALKILIVNGSGLVVAVCAAGGALRQQGIGVGNDLAHFPVLSRLFHDIDHAGHRAAAEGTAEAIDPQLYLTGGYAMLLQHGVLQEQAAQV